MLKVKATRASLDCNSTASVFQESFVSEIEEFNKQDYNDMIDSWICVEDDVEVMNAVLDEELEELESNTKPAADDAAADDAEPEPEAKEIDNDESNFVSYAETVEFLGKVQRSASKLNVQAATVHLDRFLRALHSGNAQKTRKDTTLHAYFSKK
jgi:ferredoxin-NADP reductase